MIEAPQAPIRIVDYDPSWPQRFRREQAVLRRVLRPFLSGPIEHIGSTAVVGLCAKPVIDIMAGVTSLASSEPARDLLRQVGYHYTEYKHEVMHWFCKPSLAVRTHHLHLIPFGSPLWQERLLFRNSLRAHPQLASDYAALKRRLAVEFERDREAYTEAKSPFVMRVLEATRS
jgi:GrpB-like predicted nucleotidyltransferase (UPF0157 family)